jgi:ABC-type phosphate/phosphonate transport system permease subunit
VFASLAIAGDVDHANNFLKYMRAIPALLMILELFTLRVTHCGMWTVFLAYLFYSIGDWLLIFRNSQDPYQAGLVFYMIAHGLVVTSVVMFIRGAT